MGVYIKSMEMPRWCEECPLMCEVDVVQGTACGCKGTMKIREIDNDTRPAWCPLVPVPPHGRLIDADALIKSDSMVGKIMMYGGEYVYCQAEIDRAPTIIPAEESET